MSKKLKWVAILGANGMLGGMVSKVFLESFKVSQEFFECNFTRLDFDAASVAQEDLNKILEPFDWVINCIGIIKPRIKEDAEEAILVNSLFPHKLAKVPGIKVIQIATDCWEDKDIYGRSKALGEVKAPNFANIRCSIIGPGNKDSLFDWFLERYGTVDGYTSHFWNGVTTLAFAKLCLGIVRENEEGNKYDGLNFVPDDYLSKYELLVLLQSIYHTPVNINVKTSTTVVDKRLSIGEPGEVGSDYADSSYLWELAGYEIKPTIKDLLIEMKEYNER